MFFKKPMVITVFRKTLRASMGSDVKEYEWTKDTLQRVMDVVVATFKPSKVRVLLGEDMAYVYSFAVDEEKVEDRDEVVKLVEENVPEMVSNLVWDYQISPDFALEKSEISYKVIQVSAVLKEDALTLIEALKKNGIDASVIEPVSVALAREFVDIKEPVFLLYLDQSSTLSVVYRGLVVITEILDLEKTVAQIKTLHQYVYENFGIKPTQGIVHGDAKSLPVEKIQALGIVLNAKTMTPEKSILAVNETSGFDTQSIDNKTEKEKPKNEVKSVIEQDDQEHGKKVIPKSNMIIAALLGLVILGMLGIGGFYLVKALNPGSGVNTNVGSSEAVDESSEASGSTELNEEPETSDPEEDTSFHPEDIFVSVLNGSGQEGAAGGAEALLNDGGYEDTQTGNADNYDYEGVQVKYVEGSVADDYIDDVVKILEDGYDDIFVVTGNDIGEYDIVIIVGK